MKLTFHVTKKTSHCRVDLRVGVYTVAHEPYDNYIIIANELPKLSEDSGDMPPAARKKIELKLHGY